MAEFRMAAQRELWVHIEWSGRTHPMGVLHATVDDDLESARFEPVGRWSERPDAALFAPLTGLAAGPQSTGASMPLFGAIGDSAPDRWGRTLLRRLERARAREEGRAPRVLREPDFLLGVGDEIRAGALRFSEGEKGPFLGLPGSMPLPALAALGRLRRAVLAHEEGRETPAQAQLLLGCGQLGGSRPKACLRGPTGKLLIAKFPSLGDPRDMSRWEALALGLARDCGIAVPPHRVARVGGESVLVLERFDRAASGARIPFVSAYGLLRVQDNEAGSYAAIARAIRAVGGRPHEDTVALWRRALFSMLVCDKDNHLRNHGLVLCETGWRLAPAYDVNPEPESRRPRELIIGIDGVDNRARLDIALAAAPLFGLEAGEARDEARAMAAVIQDWRARARALALSRREIAAMEGAFEHEGLQAALRLPGASPRKGRAAAL